MIAKDKKGQCEGVYVSVCAGVGRIVWFGEKYFEMLSFCHRIISDPNQSQSDISSDGLLKIILSPGDAPVPVHEKMVKFLPTYYLELDKISPTENLVSDDDDINDI